MWSLCELGCALSVSLFVVCFVFKQRPQLLSAVLRVCVSRHSPEVGGRTLHGSDKPLFSENVVLKGSRAHAPDAQV